MLAARAGMPEPQEDDKTGRMRSRILSMNKEAARFSMPASTPLWRRPGRPVPTGDGAAWTTRPSSGSGWAMPQRRAGPVSVLRDKGYNQQELDASGLFKRSPSGRIYCLFWKRVMTPF